MRDSLALAERDGWHEYAARGYTNLAELLFRFGRYDELAHMRRRRIDVHPRARLLVARVQPRAAPVPAAAAHQPVGRRPRRGLRTSGREVEEPGMLYVYSVPPLARLLARRGDAMRPRPVTTAWQRAASPESLLGRRLRGDRLGRVGLAERCLGGHARIGGVIDVVLSRTGQPGAAPLRGEFLRYLARLGVGADRSPACRRHAAGHRAGLCGEWQAAAALLAARWATGTRRHWNWPSPGSPSDRRAVRPLDELGAGRRRGAGPGAAARLGVSTGSRGARRRDPGEPGRADRAPARCPRPLLERRRRTPRSPGSSCSRCAPSTTTWRRSSPSSA